MPVGEILLDVSDVGPASRIRKRTRPTVPAVAASLRASNRVLPPLSIEYVPIASIKPYGKTLRPISEKHLAAVTGSLKAFSFVVPVLVDNENVVVDGHVLVLAAERLGIEFIPIVRVSHLSPDLIKACRVALNKLSEGGRWDDKAIRLEMIEIAPILIANDIEIESLGFSVAEFDVMMSGANEADADRDDRVEPSATAVTQTGDLWNLGQHRLLCGNSLEDASFVRLMDGEKARLSYSDPPYNLEMETISGLGASSTRTSQWPRVK